jgi:hypothetical protein
MSIVVLKNFRKRSPEKIIDNLNQISVDIIALRI